MPAPDLFDPSWPRPFQRPADPAADSAGPAATISHPRARHRPPMAASTPGANHASCWIRPGGAARPVVAFGRCCRWAWPCLGRPAHARRREPADRHGQPHRGLRADRRLRNGRPRLAGRLDRLAVLAALRFRACFAALLGTPRRPLADRAADGTDRVTRALPRRHPDPRDRVRDRRRQRHGHRLHAVARATPPTSSASSTARGKVAMRTEFVLRFDYGSDRALGHAARDGALRASPARTWWLLRTPVAAARRGLHDGRASSTSRAGEACPSS